ncbi:MAG: tetratricopeptide repeat protein [Candidatus Acidiferrales bacterium]
MAATAPAPAIRGAETVPRGWSLPSSPAAASGSALSPGTVLGTRYEIVELLGQGGMGAVYKAKDRELDRLIALKVIRPELAVNPEILRRFKQELILARKITHRNVIRIFDLGEADGIKFITMEYIEGRDLKSLMMEKGKLSFDETGRIIEQVCLALEAAHAEGVVHRDLKPQNIMLDKEGKAAVMDFGIARSIESDGMTQTGVLVGTPDYISPEQVMGERVDVRSDLFALGVILYELLTGSIPYKADTTRAAIFKRTREIPRPPFEADRSVPRFLSDVTAKCLQMDPAHRYQSAREILQDLEAWRGGATRGPSISIGRRLPALSASKKKWIVAGAALAALVIAGLALRERFFSHGGLRAPSPAVSLAILPFRNASGDPSLDWLGSSLADMLSTDVGQSAQLRFVPQDRLREALSNLRVAPGASIEQAGLRQIAESSKADSLVSGEYARSGGQLRIVATLQDLKHHRSAPIKIEGIDEKDIPGAVDRLAASIRNGLGFSRAAIQDLQASSFRPSSRSAPALRDYEQGIQLLRNGKNLDAVVAFQSASKEDPEFALAYSGLADADSELGYDNDAEQASREAVDLSQQLPMAEKYLIQATHARVMNDNKKAIEAYENLAKSMPEDSDLELALGSLYADTGSYDEAREQVSKLLESDPGNIRALWQMGVVDFLSGNPQAALNPLNQGLSLAVQWNAPELKALILQAMGISYRLMNKPDAAIRSYQDAMDINRRLGLKRALASNLVEMAVVQNNEGKIDAALSDYNEALQLQREIGMKKEVGDTLIDMGVVYQSKGDYEKALQNYMESLAIQRDTGDENYQALCLNNIGDVYLGAGDTDNALTYLQQALKLREKLNLPAAIAETLSALGQVYDSSGQYDQALTTSMRALDLWRKAGSVRGAAYESHDIGLVFRFQGRFGAAVNAMQDAVNGYHAAGDRSSDMVELLNDLADSLALAGRASESGPLLHEAQSMELDLKNESAQAELLSTQGDVQRYSGNSKSAGELYQQALRAALRGTDPDEILICKLHVAEIALGQENPDSSIQEFRKLTQQADSRNQKYLSLESSVDMAEAMNNAKDYSRAQQELQTDLSKSEKLESRCLSARIQYLLGNALRLGGKRSDASGHYQQALNLIENMRKDAGAEKLLERSDLKTIYTEASRFAAAKN